MISTELNVLDQLYLHLDREDEPWSVHLEVAVEGEVDEERLRDAVRAGMRAHPIARARLRRPLPTDVRYHWEIAEEVDEVPLEVVACEDDAALDAARERLDEPQPVAGERAAVRGDTRPPPGRGRGDVEPRPCGGGWDERGAADGLVSARLRRGERPVARVDPLEVRDIASPGQLAIAQGAPGSRRDAGRAGGASGRVAGAHRAPGRERPSRLRLCPAAARPRRA